MHLKNTGVCSFFSSRGFTLTKLKSSNKEEFPSPFEKQYSEAPSTKYQKNFAFS
jgi:hypothetical protein